MDVDDDDFDDLLASDDMLDPSSQNTPQNVDESFCLSEEELPSDTLSGLSDVDSFNALDVAKTEDAPYLMLPQRASPKPLPRKSALKKKRKVEIAGGPRKKPKSPMQSRPSGTSREQIEAVFRQISDDLTSGREEIGISLNLRPKRLPSTGTTLTTVLSRASVRTKRLCFPGRTEDEAWRFTVVIRILELMHGALCAGITISKRDIYYRDPALFGNQRHVDRYVDDIAFTFGVPRSALNVTAVAKGLVAGAVSLCRKDGCTIDVSSDREGMLVLNLKDISSIDLTRVKWILVIEKEASFRSLAASSLWDRLAAEGILITGKGYPDIATRALLRCLCTPSPQNGFASPPCFALVDYDPDGLAIMSVYKHGSIALAHESAKLKVPQLQWLGLRYEHMTFTAGDSQASQGLLTLSSRDRAKARKMLERGAPSDELPPAHEDEIAAALRVMLMLNIKAELQLLDAAPTRGMAHMVNAELDRCTLK